MPYKDPEAKKQANKRYYAEKAPDIAKTKHEYHQKMLLGRRKAQAELRLKQGRQPRAKGPKSRAELLVPLSRRWLIYTEADGVTRCYFTSKKGFTAEELFDIMKHFTLHAKASAVLPKEITTLPKSYDLTEKNRPAPAKPQQPKPASKRASRHADAAKPRGQRQRKP